MCLCTYKIYILYYYRLSCLFAKGEKTAELVFLISGMFKKKDDLFIIFEKKKMSSAEKKHLAT